MSPRFLLSFALLILLTAPLLNCGAPEGADPADRAEIADVADAADHSYPEEAADPAYAAASADASEAAEAAEQGDVEAACHPSYPDFCIPPPPPDLNCPDVSGKKPFRVRGADPHRFDRDRDGWACEPNPRRRRN